MKKRSGHCPRRGKANALVIVLIVVGAGFFFVLACGGVLLGLLLPAIGAARQAAQRAQATNNMKQIVIALHNYQATFGSFPPAVTFDEQGRPLHSWRVLILPAMGDAMLYEQYDMSEPWDGPHNSLLLSQRPGVYDDPRVSLADPSLTTFQAIYGPGAAFDPEQPRMSFADFKDGMSRTAMVVENVGSPVPWTQPDDTSPEEFITGAVAAGAPQDMVVVAIGDGSVKALKKDELTKSLTTRAAND